MDVAGAWHDRAMRAPGWSLDLTPLPPQAAPTLDADQARVVQHSHGPLLVLAGPGTGKTTTIVESVVARIEHDAVDPAEILVLTFGRRAAQEVRERIMRRLAGGTPPGVFTFHAFAYALVREWGSTQAWHEPPRLLSGAEEDARIRELLKGAVADGSVDWPAELAAALPTVGLAREVRSFLARARERGLSPAQIAARARELGNPTWEALATVAQMDQEVMDLENVVDYTELMYRAVEIAQSPATSSVLRSRFRAIYIDEYQDTDPVQVQLVRALSDTSTCLVAVGDPDQAIYGFRGADVRGITSFPEHFRTASGAPAPVVVLSHTRRFGAHIRSAAASVLPQRSLRNFAPELRERHRHPQVAPGDDHVRLLSTDSLASLTSQVAHDVRTAHLLEGVPWSDMAILVRTGAYLEPFERALRALGVPVSIAADDLPLRAEPAVAALLSCVQIALRRGAPHAEQVMDFLAGPMVAFDPADLRHLGRLLRSANEKRGEQVYASRELIASAIASADLPDHVPALELLPESDSQVRKAVRVRAFLESLRALIDARAPIDEILWRAWSGTPDAWAERLRQAALAGSSSAHHDIDAVMAMFDSAERMASRYRGVVGVRSFIDSLAGQEIPAEPIAERAISHDGVRLLTAHRAKGLEFDRVWVAGVQEGMWPDLRPRGTVLDIDALDPEAPEAAARMAAVEVEERNLLYVACTRARHELTLAVIDSPDAEGEQPSRYIDLVRPHVTREEIRSGRPSRLPTWAGLVAEWRAVLMDPSAPADLVEAAAAGLRELAEWHEPQGTPVFPAADSHNWWGLVELTHGPTPVRPEAAPIEISGSALDTLVTCPLQWFADKEAMAHTLRASSTQFGSVVHAVAEYVAKQEVPADLDEMDALLDQVWARVPFDARWQSVTERRAAREALARFLQYSQENERELLTTEVWARAVVTVIDAMGNEHDVSISGFLDRLEKDSHARVWAVDLKNQGTPPASGKIAEHGQLGIYQLLVEGDPALAEIAKVPRAESGGAALVQLRVDGERAGAAKVQVQAPLEADEQGQAWIHHRLAEAAQLIRDESFEARVGDGCSFCNYKVICPAKREGLDIIPVIGAQELDDE